MTPEEAKNKMEEMARNVGSLWLPEGFKVSVDVPRGIADLTRLFYEEKMPFQSRGPFAAGEVFYYQGIRCVAG